MIRWSTYPLLFVLSFGIVEAMLLGYSYFIIFTVLIFMTVATDVVLFHLVTVPGLRAVRATRRITPSGQHGWFDVVLEFAGGRQGLLYFRYEDKLSEGLNIRGSRSGSVVFRGRRQSRHEYGVTSSYFGRRSVGPLVVTISDPFGLCYFSHAAAGVDKVSIPPLIAEKAGMRGFALRGSMFVSGASTLPRAGQGYQFLSIRQYTVHDDPRRIAWNRFGIVNGDDVYVKEMEDERNTDTVFVIDYSSSTDIGQTDRIYCSEVTSAIRASFGICRQGDRVGFLLFSSTRKFFVPPGPVSSATQQLQTIIRSTEPDGIFDLFGAIRELKKRYTKGVLTILVSPLISLDAMSLGKDALSMLSKRTVRLVVPEASTYFAPNQTEARFTLMRMVTVWRRGQSLGAVKFLNEMGVKARLSSSKTLLSDIAYIWYEGRYSYAGF